MSSALTWDSLEVIDVIGQGQAGKVWRAKLKHQYKGLPAGSLVAVKTYKRWILEQPRQFERIIRELEIGRKTNHPSLVKTLSIIGDSEEKPALVMEYCAGETLEQYLERMRRNKEEVPIDFAFKIVRDIASALVVLHEAGAVHRDVKPANIMIAETGAILMDLGVVSVPELPEETTTGHFLGTIRYAAPEYLFGNSWDSRIDVYSLGAVAYEIFALDKFMAHVDHWAQLIVAKQDWFPDLPALGASLTRRATVNCAEFVCFLLNGSVSKVTETSYNKTANFSETRRRDLDLKALSYAIDEELWKKPFHVKDGTALPGPDAVNSHAVNGLDDPIAIAKRLKAVLTNTDLSTLHVLLQDYYWNWSWESGLGDIDRAVLDRLRDAGALFSVKIDYDRQWFIDTPVKEAFRYGLI